MARYGYNFDKIVCDVIEREKTPSNGRSGYMLVIELDNRESNFQTNAIVNAILQKIENTCTHVFPTLNDLWHDGFSWRLYQGEDAYPVICV